LQQRERSMIDGNSLPQRKNSIVLPNQASYLEFGLDFRRGQTYK
jgi:hypothetical protein